MIRHCGCCDRDVPDSGGWDGLYGCCHNCAFCASLEHFPCCHGACGRAELAVNSTPAWVDEVLREMPGASVVQQLAAVMKRSKGSANPKQAIDLLYEAHKGV
jgi:hypothetical protein